MAGREEKWKSSDTDHDGGDMAATRDEDNIVVRENRGHFAIGTFN